MGAVHGRSPSPSQVAIGRETREAAQRALATLPPTYQEVIRLVQGEGLTLAQAGERMGRSRDAVKGLYSRALGRLANELNIGKDPS
jgi:RNA polymerase sigma factor (sigma-70 family)